MSSGLPPIFRCGDVQARLEKTASVQLSPANCKLAKSSPWSSPCPWRPIQSSCVLWCVIVMACATVSTFSPSVRNSAKPSAGLVKCSPPEPDLYPLNLLHLPLQLSSHKQPFYHTEVELWDRIGMNTG